jgi:endonuclease YncB( thermonuclease family)
VRCEKTKAHIQGASIGAAVGLNMCPTSLPPPSATSRPAKLFAPSACACRPICSSRTRSHSSGRESNASGTIRADGHSLDLYGAVLIRRDRICASPEGARWTCGQRAFMAMRALVEGQPISCSFRQAAGAPKAVCWVGDDDVTKYLLSQGWAELAEGVTEESYVEALASARRSKAGIWGDGPP